MGQASVRLPIGPCHPCPLPACPAPPVGPPISAHAPPPRLTPSYSAKARISKKACTSSIPSRFRNSVAPTNAFQPHRQTRANSQKAAPAVTASRSLVRRAQWLSFRLFPFPPRAFHSFSTPASRSPNEPDRTIRPRRATRRASSLCSLATARQQRRTLSEQLSPPPTRPTDRPPVPKGLSLLHDRRPLTTASCTEYQPCCRGTGGNPPRSPALPAACRLLRLPQRSRRRLSGPRLSITSARRPRAY